MYEVVEDILQIPKVGDEDVVPAPPQSPPPEVLGPLFVIAGNSAGVPNIMTGGLDPVWRRRKPCRLPLIQPLPRGVCLPVRVSF